MALEGQDNQARVRDAMRTTRSETGASQDNKGQQDAPRGDDSRRSDSRRSETGRNVASLATLGRMNPTPIAMSNTAEALEQFRRDFVEAMPAKDDNNVLNVNIFPVDAATAGVPFSMVIVAGTKRGKEDLGVGYHAFLLAGSAEPLRPREDSYRGTRVTIVQVPGDGYDNRTRDVIKEVLRQHYGPKELFSADAEVIIDNFPTAKNDPAAIADCVKNAFAAIKTSIDRNDPDAVVLTLKSEDDNYNSVHVQHRQNHIFDRGHQPIRADVVIDLQSRENRGRNSRDAIEQLMPGTRIARIGGYYDVVYAPAEGARSGGDFYRRDTRRSGSDEYQLYALRYVTTFVDTVDFSPFTMILAQALMAAAGETNEIMRAFEPNLSLGEDDTRNIGALAIEPNLEDHERGFGERINTKSTSFTGGKRQALLRSVLTPGLMFSLDVPECGASTWQHIDMMAAAQGNQKAIDRMYDAACVLTDGHFADFWDRHEPIVHEHVERIHAGYYTEGTSGSRLDIRDFDYIALLNMLKPEKEDDLEIVQRWGMAASSNEDTLITQSERYEILRDFVPTFVQTGYHLRYNYKAKYMVALQEALNRCKLSLNPTSHGREGKDRIRTTYGGIDEVLYRGGTGSLYRNQRMGRGDRDYDRYNDRSEDRYRDRW